MARRREDGEESADDSGDDAADDDAAGDCADDAKRAFQLAVRALARRPRTTAEIETLLRDRAFSPPFVAATLARLRGRGWLDDAAVVEAVVRDGERRHLGSLRIAQALARRGVPEALVERARDETAKGDLERARRLVARRFRLGLGEDERRLARAARLLRRRGYPGTVVRDVLGGEAREAVGADEVDVALDEDVLPND